MVTVTFPDRGTEKRALAFCSDGSRAGFCARGSIWSPRPPWKRSLTRIFHLPSRERQLMSSEWRRFEVLLPLQFNDG